MRIDDQWDGEWDSAPPWYPLAPSASEPDVEMLDLLFSVLAEISPRHAEVLCRRLGLGSLRSHTLQDIGEEFGVSRERVRQLESKALARLAGHVTRRKRSASDEPTALLAERLERACRALPRPDRGRYFAVNFPDAQRTVLGRVLARVVQGVRETDVVSWLAGFEELELAREKQRLAAVNAAQRAAIAKARLATLLDGVAWPATTNSSAWLHLSPCRPPNEDGGHFFSTKLNRTVGFDSGLEASFLDLLERTPSVTDYCEQPLAIPYQWFDGRHRYVPDFAVRMSDGALVLVEIKPRVQWADGINLAKWNGAIRWCATKGWGFLVTDGRSHPGTLLGRASAADGALLDRLTENGPARWPATQSGWFGTNRSWDVLLATALRYGFALQRGPFEVRRARHSPWLDALPTPGP